MATSPRLWARGFAVFQSDEAGDLFAPALKLGSDLVQPFAALFAGKLPPNQKGGMSVLNRSRDGRARHSAHPGHRLAVGGIGDRVRVLADRQLAVEKNWVGLHHSISTIVRFLIASSAAIASRVPSRQLRALVKGWGCARSYLKNPCGIY